MNGKNIAHTIEGRTLRSGPLGVLMMTIAVLVPAGINLELDPSTGLMMYCSLIFMLWTSPITFGINNPPGTFQNVNPIPSPLGFLGNLPITFLRFVFVYQMYRLYEGRTTRKRTLLVGAASELQVATIGIMGAIMPVFSLMSRFFIPLPILFLAVLSIIRLVPPCEVTKPWETPEDAESWWEQSSKDEESSPQTEEASLHS